MQFTLFFATFLAMIGLFAQLTFALPTAAPAPAADAAAAAVAAPNPKISTLKKRGFGCNGFWDENDTECHNHCATIAGYKGGYCTNAGFVCRCY